MTHTIQNRSNLLLSTGCVAMAMGMMFSAERAEAQAINATETFVQGSGNRITPGPTPSDIIEIDTPTAVIDWVPFEDGAGNALDFLPTGADVTFENSPSNLGDFAVLNRILPSTNGNVAVIDGIVVSQLRDGLGATTPGGTVAFYSPTGLLIGDNASFDVGNLILTTLDIDIASFDAFTQAGGTLSFALGPNGPQTVTISPNATITASAENSYFVVTAAQVEMFGTSDVNGTQAFVAGDEVLLTLNNGLFDIEVPIGTSLPNAININGNVGGPSSTGAGDNHLIYAVAAAQADPISLLFSGNLGFQPAASAGIVNGEIIISANYDVFGRTVTGGSVDGGIFQDFIDNTPANPTQADVFITDFTATSTLLAAATNEVQVAALNASSSVDGDLIMIGRAFSELTSSNNQTFDITGSVLVSANASGTFVAGAADAQGGVAFIDAFGGGTLNIGSDARVSADSSAGFDDVLLQSGRSQGGSAQLGSTGGILDVGGDAIVSANATGFTVSSLQSSQDSSGGTAAVFARDGGQVTIGNLATVTAQSVGSNGEAAGATGGNAIGGSAFLESTNGGTIDIFDAAQIGASAFGGSSNTVSAVPLADAGDARVLINGIGTISVGGTLTTTADAFGGQNTGGVGGDAIGGSVGISVLSGGMFTATGTTQGSASATGGEGLTQGGEGLGGIADIVVNGDGIIDLMDETQLIANGAGGVGEQGGDGFGGVGAIVANVGVISISADASVSASGTGGESGGVTLGGSGGAGTGGRAQVSADGTLTQIGQITIGSNLNIDANGAGGVGGMGDGSTITPGVGGAGTGGSNSTPVAVDPGQTGGAFLRAGVDNGRLTVGGQAIVQALGDGGRGGEGGIGQSGGDGGAGVGGLSQSGLFLLGGGDGSVSQGFADLDVVVTRSSAFGGDGGNAGSGGGLRGDGGSAAGGIAEFTILGGSFSGTAVSQVAQSRGGDGNNGGDATGGSATTDAQGGSTVSVTVLSANSQADGGSSVSGTAGSATGGLSRLALLDSTFTVSQNLDLDANAIGGSSTGGLGGNATGGSATLDTNSPLSILTVGGILEANATARGGDSVSASAGAMATGGNANLFIDGGGDVTASSFVFVNSDARGGNNDGSGDGGSATAGQSFVLVADDANFTADGSVVSLVSRGNGGDASGGGVGGNATGGIANFLVGLESGSVGNVSSAGSIFAISDANGGAGIGGGDAVAGAALVQVLSGDLTAQGALNVTSNAVGGNSASLSGFGGNGGEATGGFAIVGAFGAATHTAILRSGSADITASATGGSGGQGDGSIITAGNGGDAFGGSTRTTNLAFPTQSNGAFLIVGDTNSTINISGASTVVASGTGGIGGAGGLDQAGGNGGNGFGGNAFFGNSGFGTDAADDLNDGTSVATVGDLTLDNSGFGGNGGAGGSTFDAMGNGGDGSAGITELNVSLDQASVLAAGVTLNIGNLGSFSNGTGGDGDIAGSGFGGVASVSAVSNGELTIASINAEVSGFGGSGRIGGDGNGGGAADPGLVNGGTGIGFRNSSVTVTGDANFTATGFGGSSTGGDGGIGNGGFVTFQNSGLDGNPALQGNLTIGGFASLLAEGIGGDGGDDFTGGVGSGGLARIEARIGGTVQIDSVEIAAGGLGGSGLSAAGGAGIGGSASIISRDAGSDVSITNGLGFSNSISQTGQSSLLSANGLGGQATGGTGIGGDASGGTVSVIATDQGSIELPLTSDFGNRILGRAAGGSSSVEGGVGGFASAGTGLFEVDTGGEIATGPTLFSVFALGGSSTQAFDDNASINVDGGGAEGGERQINVTNGSTLTGEFFGGTAAGIGGNASGTGDGGSGTGGRGIYNFEDSTFNAVGRNAFGGGGGGGGSGQVGGDASGGDNDFTISNSTINLVSNGQTASPSGLPVAPSFRIFNQNLAGEGGTRGGNATGGTIDVSISNSSISGGTFGISEFALAGSADQALGTGGNASSGTITLNVVDSTLSIRNGEDTQGFDFDPVTGMQTPGEIFPGEISEIVSRAQGGAGLIAGNASSGNVSASFLGGSITVDPSSNRAGVLDIASEATAGDGADQLGSAQSGAVAAQLAGTDIAGDILLIRSEASSEAIQQGGTGGEAIAGSAQFAVLDSAIVTLDQLTVSATGDTALTGSSAGGSARITLSGVSGQPGPQVDIDSLRLAADGAGAAPGGSNNRHGAFALDVINSQLTTREIDASAAGDILAGGEQGESFILSDGGTIEASEQLAADSFGSISVTSENGGRIGNSDTLNPSAVITITSQGTIRFDGDDDDAIGVVGRVLNLSSSDIIIEDGARIGAPDVILNSLNREDTAVLGGDGTPGGFVQGEGYTLIGEELERIEVGRFTFNQDAIPVASNNGSPSAGTQAGQAIGPNDPSLIVRDYVGSGSAGDGISNVALNVNGAGGVLRIEGQAGLVDATASDIVALSAAERIEIVTPGGIGVLDVDGNPTGVLLLDADNIWAADAATIAQLQNDPNFDGRNDLLSGAALSSQDPLGYIRAGEVSISFGDTLLVRNTGTATEQGGILVGDGGLFITDVTDSVADVFAYGARFDTSTGNLITGEAFYNEVEFFGGSSGTASFNEVSAFNDCLINTGECTVFTPEPEPEPEGSSEEEEIVRQEAAQANNSSTVEAAVQTLVEVIASEEESNEDFGMDFPSFVEAEEIEDEGDIDDPVASGGDASLYARGVIGNVEVGGSSDE